MSTNFQQLYDSDISSIGSSSTHTSDSNAANVEDLETVCVQLKSTGSNGSISGNLVATLVADLGDGYDTQAFATVTLVQSDNSEERASQLVNVAGVKRLKVDQIENQDGSFNATNVNVLLGRQIK